MVIKKKKNQEIKINGELRIENFHLIAVTPKLPRPFNFDQIPRFCCSQTNVLLMF